MTNKEYGMKWFHFTCTVRSFGMLLSSAAILGISFTGFWGDYTALFFILGIFPFLVSLLNIIEYFKGVRKGIYAWNLYAGTLSLIWMNTIYTFVLYSVLEGAVGFLTGIFFLVPLTTAETVYFSHRKKWGVYEMSEDEKAHYEKEKEECIGRYVLHKTFGHGKVVSIEKHDTQGTLIKVAFEVGEKYFEYPSAIGEHLIFAHQPPPPQPTVTALEECKKAEDGSVFDRIKGTKRPVYISASFHASPRVDGKLIVGRCYGTNARKIFLECCEVFGWDATQVGSFGPMKRLYAKGAAGEGYSPWFLPHHTWIDFVDKKEHLNWWNTVGDEYIYEEWRELDVGFFKDFSKRITFVKTPKGYVYAGVFEPQQPLVQGQKDPYDRQVKNVKCYKRVEKDYCPY